MTVYVSEYGNLGGPVHAQVPQEPPFAEYTVAPGAVGAAFGQFTKMIRVHTDAVCSILVSTAGTAASTSNKRLAANQTEYFGVNAGQKLAVIANT